MGVTTALSNGISGLLTLGDALNVIGDNLANVNTTGFKASMAQFETVFAQTLAGASAPGGTLFGTNPVQLGLGVNTAAIRRSFAQGSLSATGNATDLAILGRGFFILADALGQNLTYTRDGSFGVAESGTIVDPATGFAVQGFQAVDGVVNTSGTPGNIVIPSGLAIAEATRNAFFSGNFDASGLIAVDGNTNTSVVLNGGGATAATLLTALEFPAATNLGLAVGDVITLNARKGSGSVTPATFTVGAATTLGDLAAFMQTSLGLVNGTVVVSAGGELVITSDVGTDNLLTSITLGAVDGTGAVRPVFDGVFNPSVGSGFTTTAATQAGESNTVSGLTVFDSLGNTVPLTMTFVRTGANTVQYFVESPLGTTVGNGTITYDTNGQFVSVVDSFGGPATATILRPNTGAVDPLIVNLDFASTSFLAGQASLALNTQDGFPIGDLEDFFITIDGTITGRFTNGLTQTLGQVALATFNNPGGLQAVGENRFAATANSGDPQVNVPTVGGRGSLASAFLEGSNTDLAREFSNTIVVQRGFQANARTITTADTLLQELINLIR